MGLLSPKRMAQPEFPSLVELGLMDDFMCVEITHLFCAKSPIYKKVSYPLQPVWRSEMILVDLE